MVESHTVLLMNDGTIKACGNNGYGQLGLNDIVDRKVFTDVPNITGVKQISCGHHHTMLLMNDSTIKTCGYNVNGQLGLNDLVNRTVFNVIPNIEPVLLVYLIKKKEDDDNLYNIDINNSALVYMSSTICNLDFTNNISSLSDITKDSIVW